MASEFVNFKEVKEAVSIEMVLAHYNVRLRKVNASYIRGKCPLPTHTSKDSGDSFGAHTGKNIWACQSDSCIKTRSGKKGGNVIDFVAVMEKCSIRDAALKLQNWFSITKNNASDWKRTNHAERKLVSEKEVEKGSETHSLDQNRPLEFTLKDIDSSHAYIARRGIKKETAHMFGVGFFPGKGSMVTRVVIPIHNRDGNLVAYAGRVIDDSEPKYKMPGGFQKSIELFNVHRAIETGSDCVIVVEGFFDCMHVHQAGYVSVVALMGNTLSDEQEKMIIENFSRAILLLDGDKPGREAAAMIANRLMQRLFIKVVNLPDGKQPDQLSSEEIKAFVGTF